MPPAHRVHPLRPPARLLPRAVTRATLAVTIADIAARTSDAVTRAELHGVVARMAALERMADELIAEINAEAALPGALA